MFCRRGDQGLLRAETALQSSQRNARNPSDGDRHGGELV
jgi:hypothetical protein